jgi:CRISPR-associated protein Cmr1
MIELEAKFRVVTPLFMSGSDESKSELRVPSIKGVLRFWWRALALGRLGSVSKVREEESRIFGSAGNDVGQARVHLRLKLPEDVIQIQYKDPILRYADGEPVGPGARYLGYGVVEAVPSKKRNTKEGQILRSCLKYPFEGVLSLLIRNGTSSDDIKSIESAVIAMGLFGGLGSRSRKGYGSFNLVELKLGEETLFRMPRDSDDLKLKIGSFFNDNNIVAYSGLPPYTAYSDLTRIDIVDKSSDPLRLLNSIGEAMQMYRSWGRDGKVNGKAAERNFKDDHDLALEAIKTRVDTHPRRVAFGLPHNYYFSSYREKVDVKPAKLERRASPLSIHVQELANKQYAAVTTIMPSDFLPSGERIKVNHSIVPQRVDFKVLHEFVDGKNAHGKPRFPFAVSVVNSKPSKVGAIQ